MRRPLLIAFLAAACGGESLGPADHLRHSGERELFGAKVELRSDAPYLRGPAFRDRLRRVLAMTAEFYGRDPEEYQGVRLAFVDGGVPCRGRSGTYHGCADWGSMSALVRVDEPYLPFVETTTLPHELLHLFVGDAEHLRPEWKELPRLYALLSEPYREEMREYYLEHARSR